MSRGTTRRRFLASAGVATAVGLAGCGGGGGGAINRVDSLTLHYGSLNEQIATEIAAVTNARGVSTSVKQGGSNVENARTTHKNRGAMAIIPGDIAFFAREGSGIEAITQQRGRLQSIVSLYPLPLTVVARSDIDAEQLNDLDGMTINTGKPGTPLNVNATQLVNPLDIDFETANLSFETAMDRIESGELDATIARGDWPIPAITEAAKRGNVTLLSLNDEVRQSAVQNEWLVGDPPYGALPASVYPGIDHVVDTLSIMSLLVVNSRAPKGMVAGVTAGFFDNRDEIRTHNTYLPERAGGNYRNAQLGTPLRLHEGAKEVILFSN